jgi:flagellar biosynthesis anti-sigma factor FlgM
MKVEGHRPNPSATANETTSANAASAAERVQHERTQQAKRATPASQDRVEVSPDARLLDAAVRAVGQAPDVRQDVVERARQKLAAGEVGRDVNALADKIIDSLLSR